MTVSTETEVPNVEGVKVGDIFVSSWGYDQTNVDFYQVVGLTAKRIKVKAISSRTVSGNGFNSQVLPYPEGEASDYRWKGKVKIKTVRRGYRDRPYFTVASYATASLWEGRSVYETGPYGGH